MKWSEQSLLNNLRGTGDANSEKPLENIKNSLGSLRRVAGNPLTKNEISIITDVLFFDVATNSVILPAAVPAAFQQPVPVWYFGLTDMYSSYPNAHNIEPGITEGQHWALAVQGFWQYNLFAGVPAPVFIQLQLRPGEYIIRYVTNVPPGLLNPNIDCYIRIRCDSIGYSTLVHSLMSNIMFLDILRINVNAASILQFIHPLKIGHLSVFGKLTVDSIDPRMYILNTSPQQNISDIPLKIPIEKSIIFTTQIDFSCQYIKFILFVEEVKSLTKIS